MSITPATSLSTDAAPTDQASQSPANSKRRSKSAQPKETARGTSDADVEKLLARGTLSRRQIAIELGVSRRRVNAVAARMGIRREPKLRYHAARGLAFICVRGKREYLGPYNDKETRKRYRQRLEELAQEPPARRHEAPTDDAPAPPVLYVTELLLRYWDHAEEEYKGKAHLENMRQVVRLLREHCGSKLLSELAATDVRALRQTMIEKRLARTYINTVMARMKQVFKWALTWEIVQDERFEKAATKILLIEALKAGHATVRETMKRRAIDDKLIDATLPYLPPPVADMVRLQRLSGARPGEIMSLTKAGIDQITAIDEEVWLYRPTQHKTAHRGEIREIPFGTQSQAILRPYLEKYPTGPLFRPADAIGWRNRDRDEEIRAAWVAGEGAPAMLAVRFGLHVSNIYRIIQPCRSASPTVAMKDTPNAPRLNDTYNRTSYGHAITRGIREANKAARAVLAQRLGREPSEEEFKAVETKHWSPHLVRHTAGTETRKQRGKDAAQALLGHRDPRSTERYAPVDSSLAIRVAKEIG